MEKPKYSEEQLAVAVMKILSEEGWNCYPEVLMPWGRADIVAVRDMPFSKDRCVHIVEVKTSWTLSLLEQAVNRQEYAHYVSIAAPLKQKKHINVFYERLCKERGIGIMQLKPQWQLGRQVLAVDIHRVLPARLCRGLKRAKKWGQGPWKTMSLLHEDQKRYTPGTNGKAGYSTPFRRTMDRCVAYVDKNPGCTVKDLVREVEHHYTRSTSFTQGILMWLEKREGVWVDKTGKGFRFYPIDVEGG